MTTIPFHKRFFKTKYIGIILIITSFFLIPMQHIFLCLYKNECLLFSSSMKIWVIGLVSLFVGVALYFNLKLKSLPIYILLFSILIILIRITSTIERIVYSENEFRFFWVALVLSTMFLLFLLFAKIEEKLKGS